MNRQLNDHGDNMCGILGGNIANWDYSSGINAIKHRGPDAQKVIDGIPMGRPGETQEVANAIVFLASKEASYITGEEIDINGGSHMD